MAGHTASTTTETTLDSEASESAAAPEFGSDADLRQLRSGVLFLLHREVIDPAFAEDLCNETFRIVLERLRRQPLEDPTKLAAYLAQTARNLAIADRRKAARRQTFTGEQHNIDDFADEGSDPSVAVQTQTRAKAIRKVLEEMPNVRDRQLLVRFYLNDEDKAVICHDLNLTDEHFNRVIFRARERFRVLLDKRFARPDLFCLAIA
jgi:RNA polymerase sigma-70 factor (ECF subfamily)